MSRGTQTELELHRERRLSDRKGELKRLVDLTDEERSLVSSDFFSRVSKEKDDPYELYMRVLSEWGIMCPHPQQLRLYGGVLPSYLPRYDLTWYSCKSCGSLCVNYDVPDGRGVRFSG